MRKQVLFFILGGFFITNALIAEIIGGKLFSIDMPDFIQSFFSALGIQENKFILSVGVLIWPVVFVATDLVNEFFGRAGVRFYTFVTIGLIIYAFICISAARAVTAVDFSPVPHGAFDIVFGTSQWIIFGSIVAFATSQLVDVFVFRRVRLQTGGKHLWARATGSTVVSQFIDTYIVVGIAFYLTGKITFNQYMSVALQGYIFKVGVAILITPFCYLGHWIIELFLGKDEAEKMAEQAVHKKTRYWFAP